MYSPVRQSVNLLRDTSLCYPAPPSLACEIEVILVFGYIYIIIKCSIWSVKSEKKDYTSCDNAVLYSIYIKQKLLFYFFIKCFSSVQFISYCSDSVLFSSVWFSLVWSDSVQLNWMVRCWNSLYSEHWPLTWPSKGSDSGTVSLSSFDFDTTVLWLPLS